MLGLLEGAQGHPGAGTPQHGLSSNTTALITSHCGAMRGLSCASNGPNRLGLCATALDTPTKDQCSEWASAIERPKRKRLQVMSRGLAAATPYGESLLRL